MDGNIKILNMETGECLKILNHQDEQSIFEYKSHVNCLLLIKETNQLLAGSSIDKTIKIWRLDSYELVNTITTDEGIFTFCLLSNNTLACGSIKNIFIFSLNDHKLIKMFKAHDGFITCLNKLSNDLLISASFDKTIKIWNLNSFECINELKGHLDRINNLELISNGNVIVSCSSDKSIKLWNIKTGACLKTICFKSSVNYLKKISDDLLIIAKNQDEEDKEDDIFIYDLTCNQIRAKFSSNHKTNAGSFVNQLILLSNGNLISTSDDGLELKLWNFF